ncbi:hypothetical protein [Pseudaquabacterium rugosum]|uniref:Uncharacterized protein n=1 Tax=Pseudaquabacterium rugosum TaxID=2984194 RepID=A0ABU9B5U4_9BURK
MQLTRIRQGSAIAAFISALLVGPAAQGAVATVPEAVRAAAEAARRDVDPSINGAVGDVHRTLVTSQPLDAAAAARRDGDPSLNGRPVDSLGPDAAVVGNTDLTSAWAAYERCHWWAAFDAFTAAADAGVSEAARMALAMARHGRLLYGQVFVVTEGQRIAWQRLGRFAAGSAANAQQAEGATQ